jgi:hypothetical protein
VLAPIIQTAIETRIERTVLDDVLAREQRTIRRLGASLDCLRNEKPAEGAR